MCKHISYQFLHTKMIKIDFISDCLIPDIHINTHVPSNTHVLRGLSKSRSILSFSLPARFLFSSKREW